MLLLLVVLAGWVWIGLASLSSPCFFLFIFFLPRSGPHNLDGCMLAFVGAGIPDQLPRVCLNCFVEQR